MPVHAHADGLARLAAAVEELAGYHVYDDHVQRDPISSNSSNSTYIASRPQTARPLRAWRGLRRGQVFPVNR